MPAKKKRALPEAFKANMIPKGGLAKKPAAKKRAAKPKPKAKPKAKPAAKRAAKKKPPTRK